jgi:hypothetical protein
MESRIEAIELIHYLHDKTISSLSVNDDVYTNDEYSIVIKGEEYATSIEVIPKDGLYQNIIVIIYLYEALLISIENNIISFYIRTPSGLGQDNAIVITI